jgi:hypothetical protein
MAQAATITELSTVRDPKADHRIKITVRLDDGTTLVYSVNEKTLRNKTEAQALDFIDQWALANDIILPPVYVHKNDDDSWAIAVGNPPIGGIWPEDAESWPRS